MFYVYILKSLQDGELYTGFTNNLRKRFVKHQTGKVFSTQNSRPFRLIYYEACLAKEDAQNRERFLKTGWGRNFIKKRLEKTLLV
ncbi:MAG: GIY-YIG nuclease family protein [Patescibacteria group bacterium]